MSSSSMASRTISLSLACAMLLMVPGFQARAEAAEIIRPASVLLAGHLAPAAISPSLSLSSLAAPMMTASPNFGLPKPSTLFPNTLVPALTALPIAAVSPRKAHGQVSQTVTSNPLSFTPAVLATRQPAFLSRLFDGTRRLASSIKPESPQGPPPPKPEKPAATLLAKPREPFVPATRRTAELELLAQKDPESASALAMNYLQGNNETRREIRLAALRVLEAMSLAKVLPFYRERLAAYADPLVQQAKELVNDPAWYIQRAILLRLMREAESVKSDESVVNAVKIASRDYNASVRLAAAAALRAMNIEPGPEIDSLTTPSPPALQPTLEHDMPGKMPSKRFFITLYAAVALIAALEMTSCLMASPSHSAPIVTSAQALPPPPSSTSIPAIRAPTQNELLQRLADSDQRLAAATQALASAPHENFAYNLLSSVVTAAISVLILFGIYRLFIKPKQANGAAPTGPTMTPTADIVPKTNIIVEKPFQRFSDIEGNDETSVEIQEILDYLRHPEQFRRMGAHAPKGVLLEGPPGTGKTLMARALAGETDSAFLAISGSDFVEKFVGVGASRVRELFAQAAQNKPSIIFIDEIDAVGRARNHANGSSNDEREQTLNALLSAMDGFDNSGGVIVIAATNRADILDPALLRAGRFDRKIYVGKPSMRGREAIATLHATKKRLGTEVNLAHLARRTAGLAGADIANILNEAALQAIRRGADAIETKDIEDAIDRGTIGAKRHLPMSDAIKERVSYHEAGHVLANLLHENPELRRKAEKLTIIPHGANALGFAEMGSEDDENYLNTREELEARIDHALGGLVAEKVVYGKSEESVPANWSTGPGSDLEVATNIARMMVQNLGMGEETGLAVTTPDQRDPLGRPPFGEAVAEKAWREVNKILDDSLKRVTARLARNRHVLEALAKAVLEKETLIREEIEDIVSRSAPALAPHLDPSGSAQMRKGISNSI